jgi:hypothetical protein
MDSKKGMFEELDKQGGKKLDLLTLIALQSNGNVERKSLRHP